MIYLILLVCVNIYCICGQEVITPGVDIRWTLKESQTYPQSICFTCPALVSMGTVIGSYCGNCFGVWIPAGGSNYCLHYKGPTTLDYDKTNEYKIGVSCQNGANLDNTNVILKITPNSSPYFTKSTSISVVNGASNIITKLEAKDYDNDVLTWTIEPHTYKSKFAVQKLDNSDAQLNRLTDLSEVCEEQIELKLIVSDGFNPPVGTTTVSITLDNHTPQVTSLNREIQWNENKVFYTFFKGPNVGGGDGTCTIGTDPTGYENTVNRGGCGTTSYKNPYIISPSAGYDFEKTPSLNITIFYQKGKCPSKPAWVKVTFKNVNEKPNLSLFKAVYSVQEGSIDFQPEYDPKDPDADDERTYKLSNPKTAAPFEIDEKTGRLYTNRYFSIGGAESLTKEIDVYVTDKAGLNSDPAKVTVTINDVNDNAPILDAFQTTFTFQDCIDPGLITTITAQDADPGVNGEVEFEAATTDTMSLQPNGELLLTKAPFHNQFDTINIKAKDKGEPVKYSDVKQLSVIGVACPTTPPPYVPTTLPPPPPTTTPVVTTPEPTTIPTTVTDPPPELNFFDDPWNIVLLALAGVLALVAVIGAMCFVIRCSRICCNNPSAKTNMVRPHQANPTPQKDPPPQANKGTTPRQLQSDFKTEKRPDGDAESGVFEAEEEEVFDDKRDNKGDYMMHRPSVQSTRREYSPARLTENPRRLSVSPFNPEPTPRGLSITPFLQETNPDRLSVSPFQPDITLRRHSLNPFEPVNSPRRLSLYPFKTDVSPFHSDVSPFRPVVSSFRVIESPVRPRAVIYSNKGTL